MEAFSHHVEMIAKSRIEETLEDLDDFEVPKLRDTKTEENRHLELAKPITLLWKLMTQNQLLLTGNHHLKQNHGNHHPSHQKLKKFQCLDRHQETTISLMTISTNINVHHVQRNFFQKDFSNATNASNMKKVLMDFPNENQIHPQNSVSLKGPAKQGNV